MRDLDRLALAMPEATKEISDDGRPAYLVHGKVFCFHRGPRRDALDPGTGERLEDVLMFRVDGPERRSLSSPTRGASSSRLRISMVTRRCCFGFRISRDSAVTNSGRPSSKRGSRALISVLRRLGSASTSPQPIELSGPG